MLFYGPQMGFRTGTQATKTRAHTPALVSKSIEWAVNCVSQFSLKSVGRVILFWILLKLKTSSNFPMNFADNSQWYLSCWGDGGWRTWKTNNREYHVKIDHVSKKQIQVLIFIALIHPVTRDHTRHNVNPLYHFAFGSHQSRSSWL